MAERDDRRRSGEHLPVQDGDTPERLASMAQAGAVAAELRSIRRENALSIQHIEQRIDDRFKNFGKWIESIATDIKTVASGLADGREHCASHDSDLRQLGRRVGSLETRRDSGEGVSYGKEEKNDVGFLTAVGKNRATPWALCLLLAIVAILAALTGRDARSIIPYPSSSSSNAATALPLHSPRQVNEP